MSHPDRSPANTQHLKLDPAGASGSLGADPSLSMDRWNRGAWLFRDRTCTAWKSCWMRPSSSPALAFDSASTGSSGWFPPGRRAAGLLSLVIPLAAWIRGVPYVTLARMAANLGIVSWWAPFLSSATSSISPGRPTAAITVCSSDTWASLVATPAATGPSCCCLLRFWRWSSPSRWCWSFG